MACIAALHGTRLATDHGDAFDGARRPERNGVGRRCFLGPIGSSLCCRCDRPPSTKSSLAIRAVKTGVTEFVCHPGSLSARYDGVGDAAVVTSPTVRAALGESGVEVISYRDLAEGASP